MKKITLLLCAFLFVMTSCNKDDDNNTSQDLFIGTWKLDKYFENDVEQELELCDYEATIVVTPDGAFSETYFEENIDGVCEVQFTFSGTWENIGNGNYTISFDGNTETVQIFFENNTFYVLDTYNFGGETFVDKYVYIRN